MAEGDLSVAGGDFGVQFVGEDNVLDFICELFDGPDDIAWAWEYLYKTVVNEHILL